MPKIKTVRGVENRKVVSQQEWLGARKKLLLKEKKFSKLRDTLNLQRRKLPWVKVEKEYVFNGPTGEVTLADLFGGKSQLIIYHFMFGPGWGEGCEHCSFWADHFDSVNIHIGQRARPDRQRPRRKPRRYAGLGALSRRIQTHQVKGDRTMTKHRTGTRSHTRNESRDQRIWKLLALAAAAT